MNFTIPEQMPARYEFIPQFLDAIFPDLESLGFSDTGYGYACACVHASKQTGIGGGSEENLSSDSGLFRLMYEMAKAYYRIFGKMPALITEKLYKNYTETLFSFCDPSNNSLKGWLKDAGPGKKLNKGFETALFFTYLLLSRDECKTSREAFVRAVLSYVGITETQEDVLRKLYAFDLTMPGENGRIADEEFQGLGNQAAVLLGAAVVTICELIGSYSPEKDGVKVETLQEMFREAFAQDLKMRKAVDDAEQALFRSNMYFDPRSIQTVQKLYPQDFFVFPQFEADGEKDVMPFSAIRNAKKSSRLLIEAKTGLGKSAFLQMATICMLYQKGKLDDARKEAAGHIAEKLDVPQDMLLISIPARMFSTCFRDERYKAWTTDFVTLFFQCMWKLSEGINFYSTKSTLRSVAGQGTAQNDEFTVTKELLAYIQETAKAGKLLLILDSFDEITSGEMRTAYLKTLAAFYDKYCMYPEANEVGAHVIVSSREMSPETMRSLEQALEMEPRSARYGICPLNAKQRKELITKWNRFLGIPIEESRGIFEQIEKNHFYLDYSVNPYMLSVVCFYFGHGLGSITQRYIGYLVERMKGNHRAADPVIQDVLTNILRILQEVAGETVVSGKPHFSRRELDKYLRRRINKTDIPKEELDHYIEQLHDIFVTEVGLIVPADGADNDYQFINDQIRFELAEKGIQRVLENDEKPAVYREVLLPSFESVSGYVGLLVPLLCDINLENVKMAELLVSDLAMRDHETEEEEQILLMTILDLLLGRYGSNITTTSNPGYRDAQHVRRAQRILLMRLIAAKTFAPTKEEREALKDSPAVSGNRDWFSEQALSMILEEH